MRAGFPRGHGFPRRRRGFAAGCKARAGRRGAAPACLRRAVTLPGGQPPFAARRNPGRAGPPHTRARSSDSLSYLSPALCLVPAGRGGEGGRLRPRPRAVRARVGLPRPGHEFGAAGPQRAGRRVCACGWYICGARAGSAHGPGRPARALWEVCACPRTPAAAAAAAARKPAPLACGGGRRQEAGTAALDAGGRRWARIRRPGGPGSLRVP